MQSGLLRLFLPPKMNTKATKAAYQRRHGMAPRRPSSEEPNEEEQDEVQRQLRKHIKRTLFNEEPGIEKLSTKDAYLRRHGLLHNSGASTPIEAAPPSTPIKQHAAPGEHGEKTWAQRRKEHVLARASGIRTPVNDVDVAATAVSFVCKLKRRSQRSHRPASAAATTEALRAGDLCVVRSTPRGGAYRLATFVALVRPHLDEAANGAWEQHAFVKLSGGERAVVPVSQLRKRVMNDTTEGPLNDTAEVLPKLSAADRLIASQAGTPLDTPTTPEPQEEEGSPEPAGRGLKTAVQQKRAQRRSKERRDSKEQRDSHRNSKERRDSKDDTTTAQRHLDTTVSC